MEVHESHIYPRVEQKDSSETKRKLFEQTDSVTISRIVRLYQKGGKLSVSSRCSILIVWSYCVVYWVT